ncbi:hypothetical protein PoB_007091500 [Plakobranchus ocellatus]|uniref:Uncharacterized protein n=1 Tax=Plakobranchus ocellatus TaxID=259542 RepID=A0AAV4DJT4_9GAST|nr:hypothetical protein PoB_007091500 [Plakobranchus ocellatus]
MFNLGANNTIQASLVRKLRYIVQCHSLIPLPHCKYAGAVRSTLRLETLRSLCCGQSRPNSLPHGKSAGTSCCGFEPRHEHSGLTEGLRAYDHLAVACL